MKQTVSLFTVDIREDVNAVLTTLVLLGKPFGSSYLTNLLVGSEKFEVKNPSHKQFETYGALAQTGYGKVKATIEWLLKNEHIEIANPEYGTIAITEKGKLLLSAEHPITVRKNALMASLTELIVRNKLRALRSALALQEKKEVYEIMKDYSIQVISQKLPTNMQELMTMPGLSEGFDKQYGNLVLRSIAQSRDEAAAEELKRRISRPSYALVKELYLQNKSADEIATTRNIKRNTVIEYLCDLHMAGQINLKPWIKTHTEAKELHKGAEFFRQTQNPRLKAAYETLGLDYSTLRLCRLYVADVKSARIAV